MDSIQNTDTISLQLTEREAQSLIELLSEHFYYGWVERLGEFDIAASGRVSPTLANLYKRLARLKNEKEL